MTVEFYKWFSSQLSRVHNLLLSATYIYIVYPIQVPYAGLHVQELDFSSEQISDNTANWRQGFICNFPKADSVISTWWYIQHDDKSLLCWTSEKQYAPASLLAWKSKTYNQSMMPQQINSTQTQMGQITVQSSIFRFVYLCTSLLCEFIFRVSIQWAIKVWLKFQLRCILKWLYNHHL